MNSKRFLKYYLFATVLLVISGFFLMPVKAQPQNFKPFKMIFLPDIHVSFKEEDSWILNKESFVIFQDVIKNIKTTPELDFVVFGGDLIDNEDKTLNDLSLFLDSIDNTDFKYFTILGDREADLKEDYTKQNFCSEFRRNGFENPDLTYWANQPTENVLLIGLDTSIQNKFEGNLPPEELLWLDNTLKANINKFTVIVMHHGINEDTDKNQKDRGHIKGGYCHPALETTPSDKTVWKKYLLQNSDEFLSVINKYTQVKLILSGHHHNYAVKKLNGKLFVSLPSVVTYPNSYKILKIYPDKVEVENENISFKQIVKNAKNILAKTEYAREFNAENPKKVLKFNEGDKISNTKTFYFKE